MSALDIRQAKQSLIWWLREWGVTDDPERKGRQFIDDLVDRGWIMSAQREARPQPPKRNEECLKHPGGRAGNCGLCRVEPAGHVVTPSPDLPPLAAVSPRLAARLAAYTPEEKS